MNSPPALPACDYHWRGRVLLNERESALHAQDKLVAGSVPVNLAAQYHHRVDLFQRS